MKKYRAVVGDHAFDSEDVVPKSVILNFTKKLVTLAYHNNSDRERTTVIKRGFNDVFSKVNEDILSSHSNMLLPTGCIYSAKDSDKEIFLMQEQPGIRTFRLSNKDRVKTLVSKMYNKFEAQTRVLELNEVNDDRMEEVKKQITLRNQYIQQQKLMDTGSSSKYKFYFRVYFPYTYLLIQLKRIKMKVSGKDKLDFSKMFAAISLEPINTFNDYLHQFPLSNVSKGGSVCTGSLPLGDYGQINIKTFVEKMTGYFWNNRFNADITAGPETYGDINFLGNWFEWEYISYVNPSAILELKFNEENIIKERKSVGAFISKQNHSNGKTPISINTVDAYTLVQGFESKNSFGDSSIDLENGKASKNITGIADLLVHDGHEISVGTLVKTEKKKFKIIGFDGFKTYDVDDSSLLENETFITHIRLKDEKKRTHRFSLGTQGKKFLLDSFRRAKNYVAEAIFNDTVFTNGEVVGYINDPDADRSPATVCFDMIKSIRERESFYVIDLQKSGEISLQKDAPLINLEKVEICFTAKEQDNDNNLKTMMSGTEFTYRTQKMIKDNVLPPPHSVTDFISEPLKAKVILEHIEYKIYKKPGYSHYGNQHEFSEDVTFSYTIEKENLDDEDFTSRLNDSVEINITDTKLQLSIPLPSYIMGTSAVVEDNNVITPKIHGSETVIIGDRAYQAITDIEEGENVTFKIMRGENTPYISTVNEKYHERDNMFFKPAIHHLKSCIENLDGVKTFTVRDLYEAETETEYIHFQVGDEILLASDWNPQEEETFSIKKIYDFMILEDKYPERKLIVKEDRQNNILNSLTQENQRSMRRKYKLYQDANSEGEMLSLEENLEVGAKGVLYAVIDDGSDKLILHPMINTDGQHFLNGISHAIKEVDNLKSGDFVKADVGGIPYFAKKTVDEIVGFVKNNDRHLAILKSGYTMWADIISAKFKVFKRDKLTEKKLEFYTEKTRLADLSNFMVLYGDMYLAQIATPIYKPSEIRDDGILISGVTRTEAIPLVVKDEIAHTHNLTKLDFEALKENNDDCHLVSSYGYTIQSIQNVTIQDGMSSFRLLFDSTYTLGNKIELSSIDSFKKAQRYYDVSYSLNNRSLTNGAAYMPMNLCFRGPLNRYVYYSSPYTRSQSWVTSDTVKIAMLTFPTPRLLKKSTRDPKSFLCYKHLGPQNKYYSFIPQDNNHSWSRGNHDVYSTTSDNIFPKDET